MRRFRGAAALVLSLLVAGCGGGGDDEGDALAAASRPTTTAEAASAAPAGACGLRPLGFTAEKWRGTTQTPPSPSGILWEQEFVFSNPNTVDVRLSSVVVELDLSGMDGHFFKSARSAFRPVADDVVPAGKEQQRFAHAWLAVGNSPTTDQMFATATARVGANDCPVALERVAGGPVPAHVLALPTCDPQQATTPC